MSDSKIDRIDSKIDKIQENIALINVTLSAQHESLKDHTRRSLANEKAIDILSDKLQPIITHVAIMRLCGKILLAIAGSEVTVYIIGRVLHG